MSRRTTNRRGIKKRGIIPSFGDIVLPIVGIAAVGLLVLAGQQFFARGIQSSPGMTSTRAYTDSPAIMAEREGNLPPSAKTTSTSTETADAKLVSDNTTLAVAENNAAPKIADVKPVTPQPAPPKPAPVKPATPKPAPAKAVNIPINQQWRVQTGAYTTRALAEDAVKKIKRAGFNAVVYQNPASKHFKVWVAGGESKYQAGLVVDAMKKLGYKSAFSFPPMKK